MGLQSACLAKTMSSFQTTVFLAPRVRLDIVKIEELHEFKICSFTLIHYIQICHILWQFVSKVGCSQCRIKLKQFITRALWALNLIIKYTTILEYCRHIEHG